MDTATLQAALKISEAAISSSSLIATWLAIIMGAFSVLITAGIVFIGVKYVRDEKRLNEAIKQEVALATVGFKNILDERIEKERAIQSKETIALRSEISLVWLRNVVTSKDKDPHAIAKAIELATEIGNENYALGMISELSDYVRRLPHVVGDHYWNMLGFEEKMEKAKTIPGLSPEALSLIKGYEEEIAAAREANPYKKASLKDRKKAS